jgi:phosphatidylglycerophosphatase A
MAIKDSSDELNPTLTTAGGSVTSPRAARSTKDYLALAIATCGVGYLPLAPGTWGSLVGVGCYLLVRSAVVHTWFIASENHWIRLAYEPGQEWRVGSLFVSVLLLVITVISMVGTWAASRTEQLRNLKDPSIVVIDEVAGQMVAFIFLPIPVGPLALLVGFVAFRFFDIVKPYPARRLELLPGGLGIMGDDLVAGIYAAMLLSLMITSSGLRVF